MLAVGNHTCQYSGRVPNGESLQTTTPPMIGHGRTRGRVRLEVRLVRIQGLAPTVFTPLLRLARDPFLHRKRYARTQRHKPTNNSLGRKRLQVRVLPGRLSRRFDRPVAQLAERLVSRFCDLYGRHFTSGLRFRGVSEYKKLTNIGPYPTAQAYKLESLEWSTLGRRFEPYLSRWHSFILGECVSSLLRLVRASCKLRCMSYRGNM